MAIMIDMDMPDSCRECMFLKYNFYNGETECGIAGLILAQYFKTIEFEGRAEGCPLRDVPDTNVGKWISVSKRLPENKEKEYLITILDREDDVAEVYKGFLENGEWWTQWCHGCLKLEKEPCGDNIVTAWMPLPDPYQPKEDSE